MPHKTIGAFGDNLTLCWNESDVSTETQQRVNENQQGDYRECISHDGGNQRHALPGKCGKTKCRVGGDEGQKPEPRIWSYTNGRCAQHHQDNNNQKLQAENGAREVHMADGPTAV